MILNLIYSKTISDSINSLQANSILKNDGINQVEY
jgi:hypothetical protein